MVVTYRRVWINRVRMPILLVVPVSALELGLTRQVRSSRLASIRSFSTLRFNLVFRCVWSFRLQVAHSLPTLFVVSSFPSLCSRLTLWETDSAFWCLLLLTDSSFSRFPLRFQSNPSTSIRSVPCYHLAFTAESTPAQASTRILGPSFPKPYTTKGSVLHAVSFTTKGTDCPAHCILYY